jgi:hypothetical protein
MIREEWTEHLEKISNKISGKFKITHRPSIGEDCEYFLSQISINHNKSEIVIEQLFTQLDYENFAAGKIIFTYEFENTFDFHLYIYEREFLEKLFNRKRVETGDTLFDSKFTIKSNDKELAKKIFCNKELQNQFLSNRLLILNISSKNHVITILMKDLEYKLFNETEYLSVLESIRFIINTITD